MSRRDDELPLTQRLPADVERPDTVLFGLAGRQVAIVAGTGLALWLVWTAIGATVAVTVFLMAASPVAAVGFGLAVGRRDGISLDRWLLAAWRHRRDAHLLVAAQAPIAGPPAWVATTQAVAVPAPLRLPARGITADGLVDLGPDGTATMLACSTVNFRLRSSAEQRGLVAGYARWLNSLDCPVQVLIRSRRIDLSGLADRVDADAGGLPDVALEDAARDHAAFIRDLAQSRELLHRQVSVVVRDTRSPAHTGHRAAQAARALAACEIDAEVCDADQTRALLAESTGSPPPPPGLSDPAAIITASSKGIRR